jgi:hypothetical protein
MSPTESRRIAVFFYGLLMDVELLATRGAHPTDPRPACVPGFMLRIGHRLTLIPNAGSSAYGIVMELSHAEIEQLYSDASVSALYANPGLSKYRPEPVLAQLADGSWLPVLCFNLVVPPAPEEANPDHATKLRDLARRLKLPLAYVESIR